MKKVFADTSGFYAAVDETDPFYVAARQLFEGAEKEHWRLITTNYVVHETWALVQSRLGWEAVEEWLDIFLPLCEIEFVTKELHDVAAARCRRERLRELSLTDCTSFELMRRRSLTEAIARDKHFAREGIRLPQPQSK